jgi:hypothetical protein
MRPEGRGVGEHPHCTRMRVRRTGTHTVEAYSAEGTQAKVDPLIQRLPSSWEREAGLSGSAGLAPRGRRLVWLDTKESAA